MQWTGNGGIRMQLSGIYSISIQKVAVMYILFEKTGKDYVRWTC